MPTLRLILSLALAIVAATLFPPCADAETPNASISNAPASITTVIVDGAAACRYVGSENLTAGIADGQFTGTLAQPTSAACYSRGSNANTSSAAEYAYFTATSASAQVCRLYSNDTVDGDCTGTWDVATAAYDITFDDGAASANASILYWGDTVTSQTSIVVDLCSAVTFPGTNANSHMYVATTDDDADCQRNYWGVSVLALAGAVAGVTPMSLHFINASKDELVDIVAAYDGYLQTENFTDYSNYQGCPLIIADSAGIGAVGGTVTPLPPYAFRYLAIAVPGGSTDAVDLWITLYSAEGSSRIINAATGAITANIAIP